MATTSSTPPSLVIETASGKPIQLNQEVMMRQKALLDVKMVSALSRLDLKVNQGQKRSPDCYDDGGIPSGFGSGDGQQNSSASKRFKSGLNGHSGSSGFGGDYSASGDSRGHLQVLASRGAATADDNNSDDHDSGISLLAPKDDKQKMTPPPLVLLRTEFAQQPEEEESFDSDDDEFFQKTDFDSMVQEAKDASKREEEEKVVDGAKSGQVPNGAKKEETYSSMALYKKKTGENDWEGMEGCDPPPLVPLRTAFARSILGNGRSCDVESFFE